MNELRAKSVLVAGGAGFIGSHLVERIIEDGPANLIVIDNMLSGKKSNLANAWTLYPNLKLYEADASDYEVVKAILKDEQVDVVFNSAVFPLHFALENPHNAIVQNVAITSNLVELLRQKLYQTLIHISSSEVYGESAHLPVSEFSSYTPWTPYSASKLSSDYIVLSYCKTYGIDAAIARLFNTYGPRQVDGSYASVIPIFIRQILNGRPITIHGDGNQTRDFLFVRDAVDGIVKIYQEEKARGMAVNLATGREVTINELASMLLEVMDANVPIVHESPRPGDVKRHSGNTGLAYDLFGFKARLLGKESLLQTINSYLPIE